MKRSAKWIRFTEWEHWPTLLYYLPLSPFFIMRFLKEGHPSHFLTVNPGIPFSGNGSESKFDTLNLVPQPFRPIGFLIETNTSFEQVSHQIQNLGLDYPLIVKPDRGFRGYLVKKIESEDSLRHYLKKVQTPVLVQEFIPFENELGIFYHRFPEQDQGKITSVTIKQFLKIRGDGIKTLRELIDEDDRARLYVKLFSLIHADRLDSILEKDEELLLSVIGNHSKGTQFINGNHLISDDLLRVMDMICKPMSGFYYGRLDIKYKDMKSLFQAKDFKVLEVNGIISEPTHIYDPSHAKASYWEAMRSINEHWSIMNKIAHVNHHKHQVPYPGVREAIRNLVWLRRHSRMLKELSVQV